MLFLLLFFSRIYVGEFIPYEIECSPIDLFVNDKRHTKNSICGVASQSPNNVQSIE